MPVSKPHSKPQSLGHSQTNIAKDQEQDSSPVQSDGRTVSIPSEAEPQVNSGEADGEVGRTPSGSVSSVMTDYSISSAGGFDGSESGYYSSSSESDTDSFDSDSIAISIGDTPKGDSVSVVDATAIKKGLEGIYNDLFHVGTYCTDDLVKARGAFQSSELAMFHQALDQAGLAEVGQCFVDSALQLFSWSETCPAPVFPSELKQRIKKYRALQEKLTKASDKLSRIDTPEKGNKEKTNIFGVKKYERQVKKIKDLSGKASAISDQIKAFKEEQLDPVRDDFKRQVKTSINKQPSWGKLCDSYQVISDHLPKDVQLEAAVTRSVMTWAYNVLVHRSKERAGIKG